MNNYNLIAWIIKINKNKCKNNHKLNLNNFFMFVSHLVTLLKMLLYVKHFQVMYHLKNNLRQ